MTLYDEPIVASLLRWSWFAFTVISYVALIGYWIKRLATEKSEVMMENNEIKVELAYKKAEKAELRLLASLNALAKARDNETGNHIIRTQSYVKALALRLRMDGHYTESLSDEFIELLFKAAPLHDIGKIGIPDYILLKKGPLTDQEWEIMKTHALIGESVLSASEVDDSEHGVVEKAIKIAGGHHEKWDGTGYPRGLVGEAIPLSARIMALADMYDA
ncbi:HD-GYP domain-containing protein [Polynucleobacter sp. JS-Safj-400b-B2]|uniref:HD-GYP domain-containing protein n=1 Tax=Polynucleobacter sp. JS-Safj-400b-B2 TaxID=2576921 RepID=UPI001C0BDC3F|nr:HD domain-containing phosphohydrolase [Polynucleobacter sp. JS-Safj-400b-B2]